MTGTPALEPIGSGAYIRDVLPETYALWGDGRTFERYVDDFLAVAKTFGTRAPFTVGICDDGGVAVSCKTYERLLRTPHGVFATAGIGAVYTARRARNRGFATLLLGALLDALRDRGHDAAFLYSDIAPAFYARLGFVALPSRRFSLAADALDGSHAGATPLEASDWPAVYRCFDVMDGARPWALVRTPEIWAWMRERWDAPRDGAQPVRLVVRSGAGVAAYAIGRRTFAGDAFELDDLAYDGSDGRARVGALLRAAAGDLRRVRGWLPPAPVRDTLVRATIRPRKGAVFMIASLSVRARSWLAQAGEAAHASRGDTTWSADHV